MYIVDGWNKYVLKPQSIQEGAAHSPSIEGTVDVHACTSIDVSLHFAAREENNPI